MRSDHCFSLTARQLAQLVNRSAEEPNFRIYHISKTLGIRTEEATLIRDEKFEDDEPLPFKPGDIVLLGGEFFMIGEGLSKIDGPRRFTANRINPQTGTAEKSRGDIIERDPAFSHWSSAKIVGRWA